jgi:hypothetical protein
MLGGEFSVRINHTDAATCHQRSVIFRATGGAPAGDKALSAPFAEVAGQWTEINEAANGGGTRHECRATTRWRLGDTPGEQRLTASVKRDTSKPVDPKVAESVAHWDAVAHAPPSFIAGFSFADRGPKDTLTERAVNERGQPWFGVEFTPFVELARAFPSVKHVVRLRMMLATSYRKPGYDLYVGFSPLSLIEERVSALPVQIMVGRRYTRAGGTSSWFVGGSIQASAVLAGAFGQFTK